MRHTGKIGPVRLLLLLAVLLAVCLSVSDSAEAAG